MKKWAFVTVIMMFLNSSFATSAQGATSTIKIQKHFTATFSNSIKFAGQDCLTFQFKWNASLGLNYPYHWVTVTIENQKKKSISQNFYINPGDYYGLGQGSGVWKKTEKWELCQSIQEVLEDEDCDPTHEAEYGRECEYVEVGGFIPGKYTVKATLNQIKPFGMWDSNKITLVIAK